MLFFPPDSPREASCRHANGAQTRGQVAWGEARLEKKRTPRSLRAPGLEKELDEQTEQLPLVDHAISRVETSNSFLRSNLALSTVHSALSAALNEGTALSINVISRLCSPGRGEISEAVETKGRSVHFVYATRHHLAEALAPLIITRLFVGRTGAGQSSG